MARKRRQTREQRNPHTQYRGGYTTNKKADTSGLNFPSRPAGKARPPRRPKNKSESK